MHTLPVRGASRHGRGTHLTVLLRALVVGIALLAALAPMPSTFIEHAYSRSFYPGLQHVVTRVSSLVPVALLDLAVFALAALAIGGLARLWLRTGFVRAARCAVVTLAVAGAVLYLWFLLFWGLNYRRVPLEEKLAYDPARVNRQQALALARLAVDQVNSLESASAAGSGGDAALAAAFAEVEARLGQTRHALVAQSKRSLATWYFRKAAIDGMTNPFFLEIIVNPELLPFERPFVLAHEWAHLAGYADESEANFIAWLACIGSTPAARYSGWLSAYEHVASGLPRDDRRALGAALSPAVVADLAAARERIARASPAVSSAARGAYDTYLRANRIEEGIASYNAVVRLMLGTSFTPDWKPERRNPE